MKSILADFRRSKTAVLTISKALNFAYFEFMKNLTLENIKIPTDSRFIVAQMVKMAVFGASK